MHPCRYSYPGGCALGRYTLISTQHSLHLYQPIQLPVDYLTGETIPLKDAPINRNWKDHLKLMPTAGLVAYSAAEQKNVPEYRRASLAQGDSLQSFPSTHSEDGAIPQAMQAGADFLQSRASMLDPVLPSELMESKLPASTAARYGRESFIRNGLEEVALSISGPRMSHLHAMEMNATAEHHNADASGLTTPQSDATSSAYCYSMMSGKTRMSIRKLANEYHSPVRETMEGGQSDRDDVVSVKSFMQYKRENKVEAFDELFGAFMNGNYEGTEEEELRLLLLNLHRDMKRNKGRIWERMRCSCIHKLSERGGSFTFPSEYCVPLCEFPRI